MQALRDLQRFNDLTRLATKKQDAKTADTVKVKKEFSLADYRTVVGKSKAEMKRATLLADMPHLNSAWL